MILSKIKFQNILAFIFIALIIFSLYAANRIKNLEFDNERKQENYLNALKMDSLETTIFRINSENELNEILAQNKEMQDLVKKSQIKTKRIESLYYQQLKNTDTSTQTNDLSGMVQSIVNNIKVSKTWQDSTQCLSIGGFMKYENGNLTHGVDFRESKYNLSLIKSKTRRKPVKWLFNLRLGKRSTEFTPVSNCGKVNVTIIEKEKD